MSRKFGNRALLVGLAVALGVSALGGISLNSASGVTSYGADRLERAEGFAGTLDAYVEAARSCDLDAARVAYDEAQRQLHSFKVEV